MIKSISPLKIFLYREGLARFSTEKYVGPKKKNLNNMFMHLTNYAVNKKNPNFISNESEFKDNEGHKRSFSSVLKMLREQGRDVDALMEKIMDLIVKTTCSVQPYLAHFYKSSRPKNETLELCFEILGFDILLDENANPWLLEVNHTPSFATDSPLDWHIKKNLILDTLILLNVKNKHKKIYNEFKNIPYKGSYKVSNTKSNKPDKIIEYENKNLGGYLRIYPKNNPENNILYETFMENAKQIWDEWTGPKRINSSKPAPLTDKISSEKANFFNQKSSATLKKKSENLKQKAITLNSKEDFDFLNFDPVIRNIKKTEKEKEIKNCQIKNELSLKRKFRPMTSNLNMKKKENISCFDITPKLNSKKDENRSSNNSSFIQNLDEKNDSNNVSFIPLSARSNKIDNLNNLKAIFQQPDLIIKEKKDKDNEYEFMNNKNSIKNIVNNNNNINNHNNNISIANQIVPRPKNLYKTRNYRPNSAVFRDENIYENSCKNNLEKNVKNLPFVHYQENTEKISPKNNLNKKSFNSDFCLIGNKCMLKNKMEPKFYPKLNSVKKNSNNTNSFHDVFTKNIKIKIPIKFNNNPMKFYGKKNNLGIGILNKLYHNYENNE